MQKKSENIQNEAYSKLMWMALLSFLFMYSLMYVTLEGIVRSLGDNNPLFIALILTLPMIIIEIILLGGLNRSKTINLVVIILSMFIFVVFYHVVSNRQDSILNSIESR
ncbi:MAG: hypothetical protein ABIS36_03270 [Chryseolinea sp.]